MLLFAIVTAILITSDIIEFCTRKTPAPRRDYVVYFALMGVVVGGYVCGAVLAP
ncbi:MAG: hypothetical protein FWH20_01795 [Oscillospiraceae bacterium]|nr:hypothetical protein [Oscillospiraceae bacterium]